MKQSILIIMILGVGLSGCVKKSTHMQVTKQLSDTQTQLEDAKSNGEALKKALAKEQAHAEELDGQIAELKAALEAIEKLLADEKALSSKLQENLTQTIKDKAHLKNSAEQLKKAMAELTLRKMAAEKRVKEFQDLLKRFKKLIDAGKLKVKIKDGRMVLVLPTDILFSSGSAKLSEDGEIAISEVAAVLATIKDRNFQVEGHTDDVPITSKKKYKNNWELAAARAMVVVDTMIEAGMSGKVLSAASYGEFRPVASNNTSEGKSANRRIDIVIVPDLSNLPGFSELKQVVESN